MNGDFTRDTFDPERHFEQVLMQQGRVQLDADWNEQSAIITHRHATLVDDLVGPHGGRADAAAFGILLAPPEGHPAPDRGDFYLSAGRYYVDGILCQLEKPILFSQQPYRPAFGTRRPTDLQSTPFRHYRVMLHGRDDTERNSLQLAELELLGLPDSTDVSQPGDTVSASSGNSPPHEGASLAVDDRTDTKYLNFDGAWNAASDTAPRPIGLTVTIPRDHTRVIGLAVTSANDFAERDPAAFEVSGSLDGTAFHPIHSGPLSAFTARHERQVVRLSNLTAYLVFLDVWRRHVSAQEDERLREPALGGPDTATRIQLVWQVRATLLPDWTAAGPCRAAAPEFDRLQRRANPRLEARTAPVTPESSPCFLSASDGYRGLENQLYRIEVHHPGDMSVASFKWSRDNASRVARIVRNPRLADGSPDPLRIELQSLAGAMGDALHPDDIVEVLHHSEELEGIPGQLARIDVVSEESRIITLKSLDGLPFPLRPVNPDDNPRLKLWNGFHRISRDDATDDGFVPVEAGLEVRFGLPETAEFRSGDFWLIPARAASAGSESGHIEWPTTPDHQPVARPPQGIVHHVAKLGVVVVDSTNAIVAIHDARRLWDPLGALARDPDPTRILNLHWNDGTDSLPATLVAPLSRVGRDRVAEGLTIACSHPLDPRTVVDPVMSAADRITRGQPACWVTAERPVHNDTGRLIGYEPLILHAQVTLTADHRGIRWVPDPDALEALATLPAGAQQPDGILLRLTLKGSRLRRDFRTGERRYCAPAGYLDGDVFRDFVDGVPTLLLPSGDGHRGGDFEVEIWLVPGVVDEIPSVELPAQVNAFEGTDVTLAARIRGTGPLRIGWRFAGRELAGESASTLVRRSVTAADAGEYAIVVANSTGGVAQATCRLTVLPRLTLPGTSNGPIVVLDMGRNQVFDTDGTTPLNGAHFTAQLYVGDSVSALAPAGNGVSIVDGRVRGGGGITSPVAGISGTIYMQVRAWDRRSGPGGTPADTFERAAIRGTSIVITGTRFTPSGGPPILPPNLHTVPSFQLQRPP